MYGNVMTKKTQLVLTTCVLLTAVSNGTTVLFGGGAAGPTQGADADVFSYLQNRYGTGNVSYIQTSAAVAGDELGFDVFVISSTPGSGSIRNKFHNTTVPVVNWEEAVADNGAGEYSITSGRPKDTATGGHSITIDVDHPITTGFSVGQIVPFTDPGGELWWSTGAQAPGALSLASDDDNAANGFLTIIESGGELLNGGFAPARQVMLGLTDNTFSALTPEGQQLFGQAVDWAAVPEPSSALLAWTSLVLLFRRRRRS